MIYILMRFNQFFLLSFLALSMGGCAVAVVGVVAAAGTTTAVVATDPRTTGSVVEDNTIETKLKNQYSSYPNSNIYVNSYNGNVLLTGQSPDARARESAEFGKFTIISSCACRSRLAPGVPIHIQQHRYVAKSSKLMVYLAIV